MGVSPIQHRAVTGSYDFNRLLPPLYNKFCILYWASIQALKTLSDIIDLLKLKIMFFVNFLLINCVFTMKDLVCFPILGYLGWFLHAFGAFFDQKTCSFDAVLIFLLFDAISIGSNSILKWAKIGCHVYNLSIWKFFILIYCFTNAEWLFISNVESNPGPDTDDNFRIMHWNPNSIATENLSRVALIHAHNVVHDFHLIAITESALRQEVSNDDIEIPGYVPVRNDLPPGDRNGGFNLA